MRIRKHGPITYKDRGRVYLTPGNTGSEPMPLEEVREVARRYDWKNVHPYDIGRHLADESYHCFIDKR